MSVSDEEAGGGWGLKWKQRDGTKQVSRQQKRMVWERRSVGSCCFHTGSVDRELSPTGKKCPKLLADSLAKAVEQDGEKEGERKREEKERERHTYIYLNDIER